MGLRPALKLCNPILPPHFSSLTHTDFKEKPNGGWETLPTTCREERSQPSSLRHGQAAGAASPPPRNLRGAEPTESRRGRLSAATHSALPPEPAKAREAGRGESQTCQPRDCPLHGSECRSCVRGERSAPKLQRCPGGWMRTDSLPAPQRLLLPPNSWGLLSPGESGRPGAEPSSSSGRRSGRRGGRGKGDRAGGACCFPAQEGSEGESSTER